MIDLNKYKDFVSAVTSQESNNTRKLTNKLEELDHKVNIALLMTGGIGLASEGGEFNEIVNKRTPLIRRAPINVATGVSLVRPLQVALFFEFLENGFESLVRQSSLDSSVIEEL